MQQRKQSLAAQVNSTESEQRALLEEEEAFGLKLASSLRQPAPPDAGPSAEPNQTPLDETRPTDRAAEVSHGRQMGSEVLFTEHLRRNSV